MGLSRIFSLVCALFVLAAWRPAVATVVTFDDLDASAGDLPISSPYAGLNWSNFLAYTSTPGFDGFNNGIVSGPNAAYSGGQNSGPAVTPIIGTISSAALFDFTSAYLGAGYYDSLGLTISGLRSGSVVFSQTVTLDTTGARLFNFAFVGIDTLDFTSSILPTTTDPFFCGTFNCTQFTLDDLTVSPNAGVPNAVPEPSSLFLAMAGLVCVAAATAPGSLRRQRR